MSARALPLADTDSQPFWDACARNEFVLQSCRVCVAQRFPPSPICPDCLSSDYRWLPATGTGTVYSFVVVREALHLAFKDNLPYVVAIIRLDEGPHMLSNIIGMPVEDVRVGMPVRVCFEPASEDIRLPKFCPANL